MSVEEKQPLPKGWQWTTIGAVTEPIEKVQPKDEPEASFNYLDISGIDNNRNVVSEVKTYTGSDAPSRARQHVKAGDVLFSTVRTYLRNIAQVPINYDGQIASTGFSILRGSEGVDNKYLFYFSLTDQFLNSLSKIQRGTSYPAVRDSDVREQPIPLAPSLEQQRIVAEIEKQFTRLDQSVASLKRAQTNMGRYKASVLKAACDGRLVPQDPNDEPAEKLLQRILAERRRRWEEQEWAKLIQKAQKKVAQARRKAQGLPARLSDLEPAEWQDIAEDEYGRYLPKNDKWKEKYKEPVAPGTAELTPLPEGWIWTTIDQVTESLDHMRVPVNKKERAKRKGNIPYYGANGQVDWIDDFLFDEPLVLVVEDETFTGRKKPFCYKITGKSWVNNHTHVLRALATTTDYLNYSLAFYPFTPLTTGTTGRRKLTKRALMGAPCALPPKTEQERIVAEVERRLSVVAANEKAIDADLARAERLRQSILQQAFSGKLVPQENLV